MANWKREVKLGDLHQARRAGEMKITEVATQLVARLEQLPYCGDADFDRCLVGLRGVRTVERYDYWLSQLYNFGDSDHRLWIDTF